MNKNQRGFTLLELILAITIGSLIIAGITAAIFQVFIGNARTSSHMTAVRQVQNAGYWVSHDAQMAQSVVLAKNATGFPLKLSWVDWDGRSYNVTYTVANGQLSRQYVVKNALGVVTTDTTTNVARYIDPDTTKTKCQLSGSGTFNLPDSGDAFTISSGALADSGIITLITGSIAPVTTAGGASYNTTSGTWTTLAGGGTVTVRATAASTAGVWTSVAASATVAITADTDGDAKVTGSVLAFTVTATVRTGSQQQTETRVYDVTPRPSS